MTYNYCALDFETTGLDTTRDEVIEYGAVLFNDVETGPELASLCKPTRAIPTDATMVNHITDDMVADATPFTEHLDGLLAFIGDRTVVCHNAPFDMGFLKRYCRIYGKEPPRQVMDTCELSRRCFRHLPSHSLRSLASFLRIPQVGAHRALADARVTAQVMIQLLEVMG